MFQWQQDVAAAEKCCQEALEIDPECEAAVATLAQLSLQQGKIDVAMRMFDRQSQLARSEPELVSSLTYQYVSSTVSPVSFGLLCAGAHAYFGPALRPRRHRCSSCRRTPTWPPSSDRWRG